MPKGSVFLIPTYLADTNDRSFLAPMVLDVIYHTTHYLVENVRSARRFISSLDLGVDISSLHLEVVDKHTRPEAMSSLMHPVLKGVDVGVISEAGLPGLADPGSIVVGWAHGQGIHVVPLPGATSIQTALISSGFSGQQFTFHGYLPIPKSERRQAIKRLEQEVQRANYTQVFMETPFRNMQLLDDLLKILQPATSLHISANLFGPGQLIKTQPVREWRKSPPQLHKLPAIFCVGQI